MMTLEEFSHIQDDRAALYRLVGTLFEKPLSSQDIDAMASAGLVAPEGGDARIEHGMQVMSRYLAKRNTGTYELLNCDYTAAFYGTQDVDGRMALPYESAFEGASQRLMGTSRNKVFNIFKKQSLRLAPGRDLPEDHLSLMCEFMATMAKRSTRAREQDDDAALRESLLLQRAFLRQHILSWYPEFAGLARQLVRERFYRGALEVAEGFFELDEQVLKGLLSEAGAAHAPFDLAWWELPPHAGSKARRTRPVVDKSRCIRRRGGMCSECASACPERVDPCDDDSKRTREGCTGCLSCVRACPAQAISLEAEPLEASGSPS